MIPADTLQLVGVLPRKVAIWITDVTFLLDGATPNDKAKLLAQVATSGTYTNGYGPDDAHTFVAKSMVAYFGYEVADNKLYDRWHVPLRRQR